LSVLAHLLSDLLSGGIAGSTGLSPTPPPSPYHVFIPAVGAPSPSPAAATVSLDPLPGKPLAVSGPGGPDRSLAGPAGPGALSGIPEV